MKFSRNRRAARGGKPRSEVCLAAEHAERRGSARSNEAVDTDVEGAVPFSQKADFILATAALKPL